MQKRQGPVTRPGIFMRMAVVVRSASRRMLALVIGLFAVASLWVGGAIALDAYGQRPMASLGGSEREESGAERYDAIIVLGCRVYSDGRPSAALARRARRAIELWSLGYAPVIVFTGGVGVGGRSEASAAAELARAAGVPDEAIVLEERSTSTEENARFAAERVDARRVLVVSDAYHVFRGERVFARYFDEVRGVGSLNEPYPRVVGSLREVLAVAGYAVTARL